MLAVARRSDAKMRELKPEAYKARQSRYRATHGGRVRAAARQAQRCGATTCASTVDYIDMILRDPCVFCGAASGSVDHIVPVAKNGTSECNNLAPACLSCNASKRDKSLLEFMLWRLNDSRVGA